MLMLLKIAGGVALLLFGVRYLRKGLDRIFGARLGTWMRRVGERRGLAFLSGVVAGILAPSSTTISVLAVQTVQAGHMTPRQMLAVMLGANIGLTILVHLVALHVDEYAPILIFVGFVLFQYVSLGNARGIGQIILALGFFFLAMSLIKTAATAGEVTPDSDLAQIIHIAEKYPLWLTLIAMVMATLLQSATATIGMVIGLGAAGTINEPFAIPVVIGANVGLAITTLIVGWSQVDSRRLAVANLALKLVVAITAFATIPWILEWVQRVPAPLAGRIAVMHTGFNALQALIGLPLLGVINTLVQRLVRSPSAAERPFGPKFIHNGPVDSLALATGQSLREIMHMSEIVRGMLQDVWIAMKRKDERMTREISKRDNQVDLLDREIKRFLTRLAREEIDPNVAAEQIRQLQYLTELETAGDIIDKNLSELVLKKIRLGAPFSREGERELDDFHQRVMENQAIADAVFTTRDKGLAQDLLRRKESLNDFEQELRDRHFARLNAGLAQAHETSAIHLDLLTHLKRINSSLSHVAYALVENNQRRDAASGAVASPTA